MVASWICVGWGLRMGVGGWSWWGGGPRVGTGHCWGGRGDGWISPGSGHIARIASPVRPQCRLHSSLLASLLFLIISILLGLGWPGLGWPLAWPSITRPIQHSIEQHTTGIICLLALPLVKIEMYLNWFSLASCYPDVFCSLMLTHLELLAASSILLFFDLGSFVERYSG